MTLRRTMMLEIGAMMLGLLLLSAASLWGINALHQDFHSSIEGYQRLREVYEVGSHVTTARTLLTLPRPDEERADAEIRTAAGKHALHGSATGRDRHTRTLEEAVGTGLKETLGTSDPWQRIEALNKVLRDVANLAGGIRGQIQATAAAADANRRAAMTAMSVVSVAVLGAAVLVGAWQYRSVMRPLTRLRNAVGRIAAGRFAERVPADGHAEFAELAGDFNRMAGQLDELYRQLEEKVAVKSRELVRSERLASVGFLAAGVAHEINNPIAIIAAHAELMLGELKESDGQVQATLRVICEEAFRCKQIVGRLLALARPGDEAQGRVSLKQVADEVAGMIRGLKPYAGAEVRVSGTQPGHVLASEAEMKQVVLNLVINALEAGAGRVELAVGETDGQVELLVSDDGRGMSAEVVERVFEPFYTLKRGRGEAGTGLGLSITHAIVAGYGGSIQAHSDGPGKGSRFAVRLPAAWKGGEA